MCGSKWQIEFFRGVDNKASDCYVAIYAVSILKVSLQRPKITSRELKPGETECGALIREANHHHI